MENTQVSMPRIGDKAPAVQGRHHPGRDQLPRAVRGQLGHPLQPPGRLHPGVHLGVHDLRLAWRTSSRRLNCKLVGLSVDGLYSHIAWLRTIKDKIEYKGMKNVEVKFPLIEDITMEVAKMYGMMQPGESSHQGRARRVRHRPQGDHPHHHLLPAQPRAATSTSCYRVRAWPCRPPTPSRVATPADWRPGDDVIVPPAGSCGVAKDRMDGKEAGVTCHDWFFCTKKIDKEKVLGTIKKKK
ncbi:MAG: redoxin domain-containing protein [Desulfobacterales bacterium]|nr:redoxin domain-containing protein [Desulfobacterales bacterium]